MLVSSNVSRASCRHLVAPYSQKSSSANLSCITPDPDLVVCLVMCVFITRYCILQDLQASEVEDAELQEAIARSLNQDQPGPDPPPLPPFAHLTCQPQDVPSWHCCGIALPSIALYKPPSLLLLLLLLHWMMLRVDV